VLSLGRPRSGTRDAFDLVGAQDVGALGDERGDDRSLVGLAAGDAGRVVAPVFVAPLPEAGVRDLQVAPLLGEPGLVARGPRAVADALEDSLVDEPVESFGEHVAGNPEALLKLLEAAKSEEGVTDDQERPALADDLESARDGAVLALVVAPQHGDTVAE